MGQPPGWRRVARALAGYGLFSLAACQSPGSQPIIGPDGSSMQHVHCGADQGVCFRLAGELCPDGYEMKPVLSGTDGNFLVRCRSATAPAVGGVCPAPGTHTTTTVTSTVIARPVGSKSWPPQSEPSPAPYPWPPAETSAAARTPSDAPSDVDIGY